MEKNLKKTKKIAKILNIEIPKFLKLKFQKDQLVMLKHIMHSWLPIDKTIFQQTVKILPSPIKG